MNRAKEVAKVGIVGVIANIVLVGLKVFVGLVSGSVSVVSDAINNLSDALSSFVTIVGALLSNKKPDKKHPYGYGKIEHVSALVVAIIIFGTGVSLIFEATQKIINPENANFNILMILIITAGILIKLFLGLYVKKKGKALRSDVLAATASDALLDVAISTSALIGALITLIFGITIDGWIGLIIAAIIVKTSIEIALDSASLIIGERIDSELALKIKKAVSKYDEVLGAYDLTLHQYGPERIIGSIHIEVEDKLTAREIHLLSRKISEKILNKFGVVLTIGIYATNTEETEYAEIKSAIADLIKKYPSVLQMHGYYVDSDKKLISFDLVFDYKEKDVDAVIRSISAGLKEKYPKYSINIIADSDFSD